MPMRKKNMIQLVVTICFLVCGFFLFSSSASSFGHDSGAQPRTEAETMRLVAHGRYLATIGVCDACHTPPGVSLMKPPASDKAANQRERIFRTDPDWFRYLDPGKRMAGGVPFILRFAPNSSGIVYTKNLTPDPTTGLGNWTEGEIVDVLRTGRRKDGTALFLFPPHSFFKNLAEEDARALAVYLRSLPPVHHQILVRSLPFPVSPVAGVSSLSKAPEGRTTERAEYLLKGLVGCTECHSYRGKDGKLVEFAGGDPSDPFNGTFRLGPDLPLRQPEKGLAAFPYPGYAVLYAGNLTRFGLGGDLNYVPSEIIVRAVRQGISVEPDPYGRARPLAHIMMWQFYAGMTDDDAFALAEYIKSLRYIPHQVEPRLIYFGSDWKEAFEQAFGEKPSENDRKIFGKPNF